MPRTSFMVGDVLAWQGRGLWATLIRLVTRSTWYHVGIVVPHPGGGLAVLEASVGKGVTRTATTSLDLPAYRLRPRLHWGPEASAAVQAALGQRYSVLDCLLAVLKRPLRSSGYQCAELVRVVLAAAFVHLDPKANTPDDVVMGLVDRGAILTPVE